MEVSFSVFLYVPESIDVPLTIYLIYYSYEPKNKIRHHNVYEPLAIKELPAEYNKAVTFLLIALNVTAALNCLFICEPGVSNNNLNVLCSWNKKK